MILDTPKAVDAYRLLALKGALKLESRGMKRRGMSAFRMVKAETGLKARSAETLLPLFEEYLRERGILVRK